MTFSGGKFSDEKFWMDLLRLVLAHQPIERLKSLTKVFRDRRFFNTRAKLLNGTDKVFAKPLEYISYTESQGELSISTPPQKGTIRAIFLREPQILEYYVSLAKTFDLWYALSVDYKGITEICIRYIKGPEKLRIDFNTVETINWTPELIEAFRSPEAARKISREVLSGNLKAEFLKAEFLQGFLDLPSEWKLASPEYILGTFRRIVPIGKEYERNEEAEKIFSDYYRNSLGTNPYPYASVLSQGAYFYPLLEWAEDQSDVNLIAKLAQEAYYNFLYEILEKLREFGYFYQVGSVQEWNIRPVTRNKIPIIQKIYNNQKIMAMFTPEMRAAYAIILGYQLNGDVGEQRLRSNVENPDVSTGYVNYAEEKRSSLQSLVLYDPAGFYNSLIPETELIRLGKGR